jgi:hypothetical protein
MGKSSGIFKVSVPLFFVILFFCGFHSEEEVSARNIVNNMYAATGKIKSLKFVMKKMERVGGKYLNGVQAVKYNRNPRKVYTEIISPNKGVEVLYVEGKNNNHAYVNPNAFPYITLSLDPYGSIMRKNNHHTVHEVGFDYISGIIKHVDAKAGNDFNKIFRYTGDTVFNNRKCYKLLIDYTPFAYINYTVKKGETLKEIAYRLFVSDYMIMTINKGIDDYDDVAEGQVIKVPNAYARKTLLLIQKDTYLPVVQVMSDEKGLFSRYEFYDLIVGPEFSEMEFSKDYEKYNF